MREELWESERQQTTHGLYFIPTDLNKHQEIDIFLCRVHIILGRETFAQKFGYGNLSVFCLDKKNRNNMLLFYELKFLVRKDYPIYNRIEL